MLQFTVLLTAAALLLGCTSKEESQLLQDYSAHASYHEHLQKTEKVQLYEGNVTKAMLTATYLYAQTYEKHDTRDEVFIVGVYLEDEALQTLQEGEYTLTLNGSNAKEALQLDKHDERLKALSFVMEWGSYYLVTFPHVEAKDFKLTFKSAAYGEGTLHFAKVAKYILSKEAF